MPSEGRARMSLACISRSTSWRQPRKRTRSSSPSLPDPLLDRLALGSHAHERDVQPGARPCPSARSRPRARKWPLRGSNAATTSTPTSEAWESQVGARRRLTRRPAAGSGPRSGPSRRARAGSRARAASASLARSAAVTHRADGAIDARVDARARRPAARPAGRPCCARTARSAPPRAGRRSERCERSRHPGSPRCLRAARPGAGA